MARQSNTMVQHTMKPEEEGGAAVSPPAELPRDQPDTANDSAAPSEAGDSMASTNANSVIFTPDGSVTGTPEETTPRPIFNLPYRPAPNGISLDDVLNSIASEDEEWYLDHPRSFSSSVHERDAPARKREPEPEQPKPMSKSAKQRLRNRMKKLQELQDQLQQYEEEEDQDEESQEPQITSSSRGQRSRLKKQFTKHYELKSEYEWQLQSDWLSASQRRRLRSKLKTVEQRVQEIRRLREAHDRFLVRQAWQREFDSRQQELESLQEQLESLSLEEQQQQEGASAAIEPVPPVLRKNQKNKLRQKNKQKLAKEKAAAAAKAREEEADKQQHFRRKEEVLTEGRISELFDDYFGDRKLANWQRFCIDLGLEDENLSSLKQCKKALESIHINIYDLMDAIEQRKALPEEDRGATPLEVKKFDSAGKLFKHAKKNGGLFPRQAAKEGGPLRGLLKRFH